MKRITITLTEDQAFVIVNALEGNYYGTDDEGFGESMLNDWEKRENAFMKRIIGKIYTQLAKAKIS